MVAGLNEPTPSSRKNWKFVDKRKFVVTVNDGLKQTVFNVFKSNEMETNRECPGWISFSPRTIHPASGTHDLRAKKKIDFVRTIIAK